MVYDSYRLLTQCRLCAAEELDNWLDFGLLPLGNNLQNVKTNAKKVEEYPLAVNRCRKCGHFQLSVSVHPTKLYAENYTYLSGIAASFISHFKEYSVWAKNLLKLKNGAFVVDIGSNDGSCLKEFKSNGFKVLGIDPASVPAEVANNAGIPTINDFFSSKTVETILMDYGHADFITSHNVLAHVEDLRSMFINIYELLKENGYFCFEIGYFCEVVNKGYFDTIYHEHLDYHHAAPLAKFLRILGFDVIDISINEVQGGTLRMLLQKTGKGSISNKANDFVNEELKSLLYNETKLNDWRLKIAKNMEIFSKTVKNYKRLGKDVVGYGAPTKATLLLRMSGLDHNHIDCVVEDNPLKVGKYLPKSRIEVVPTEKLTRIKPEVVVIFAWNFEHDITKKLSDLVDWPMKIIVPLPNVKETVLK